MKMTSLDNKCNMFKCSSMASLMSSRLSPCLPPPVQPISRSRCSSLVLDKCDNDLSCGSISPIPPSCRTPASINKDIKIFVTDMMNNNNDEVFANLNNDQSSVIPVTESETMLAPRTVSASCLSRSSLTTSLLNTSLKKSHLLVLTWATVSTAALGTCVGLALALTSLDVGISVASLGVAIILFIIFLSYRVLKTKSRRSGYRRLGGVDCSCSPSMPNIFYQCQHELLVNNRRGSAGSEDLTNSRRQRRERVRGRGL